jgi:hypothetical protein
MSSDMFVGAVHPCRVRDGSTAFFDVPQFHKGTGG